MTDLHQDVSGPVHAVLDELEALREHRQWGKASVEALLIEIDLLGDTVFGKLHSLKKGIDAKAPGADVALALAAVEVAQMPAAKRMAAFLLLAIEQAATAPVQEAGWLAANADKMLAAMAAAAAPPTFETVTAFIEVEAVAHHPV
jgi:hypothetical protein